MTDIGMVEVGEIQLDLLLFLIVLFTHNSGSIPVLLQNANMRVNKSPISSGIGSVSPTFF